MSLKMFHIVAEYSGTIKKNICWQTSEPYKSIKFKEVEENVIIAK